MSAYKKPDAKSIIKRMVLAGSKVPVIKRELQAHGIPTVIYHNCVCSGLVKEWRSERMVRAHPLCRSYEVQKFEDSGNIHTVTFPYRAAGIDRIRVDDSIVINVFSFLLAKLNHYWEQT